MRRLAEGELGGVRFGHVAHTIRIEQVLPGSSAVREEGDAGGLVVGRRGDEGHGRRVGARLDGVQRFEAGAPRARTRSEQGGDLDVAVARASRLACDGRLEAQAIQHEVDGFAEDERHLAVGIDGAGRAGGRARRALRLGMDAGRGDAEAGHRPSAGRGVCGGGGSGWAVRAASQPGGAGRAGG